MASIVELKDRKKNPFKAQIRNKGFEPKIGYFPSWDEAKEWCDDIEADQRRRSRGQKPTLANLSKLTVGMLLETYMEKVSPYKASALSETKDIKNFLAWKDVRNRPLIAFDRYEAQEYIDYLEKEHVWKGKPYMRNGKLINPKRDPKRLKPATIKRVKMIMHHAWNTAEAEWRKYEGLDNPWMKVKVRGKIKKRTRRLNPGELGKLLRACNGCKGDYRMYSRIVIYLTLETGMRLQEIFNLDWRDINLDTRRIHIRKTKTDYKRDVDGRWIVLTVVARMYLHGLVYHLDNRQPLSIEDLDDIIEEEREEALRTTYKVVQPQEGPVFPQAKINFKQMWRDIIMRSGIPLAHKDYIQPHTKQLIQKDGIGLTFHDLRREAASRFKRCLYVDEIGMMLGHGDKTITELYLTYDGDDLTEIQNKLDRYALGGLTWHEAHQDGRWVQIIEDEEGDAKLTVVTPETEHLFTEIVKVDSQSNVVPFQKVAQEA